MDTRYIGNRIVNSRTRGEVVILVGECVVNYDGRAWSYTEGKHSVTINPSGSVIVHNSSSVKPKNWQPSDAETKITIRDENLVVESERQSPNEELIVTFNTIESVATYQPTDSDFNFEGSEKQIHKHIVNNPELISEEFKPICMEKEVKTGDIDIFGTDNKGRDVIVEVKRKRAQQEDVGQLRRYMDAFSGDKVGVLVAPSITDPASKSLHEKYDYEFRKISPRDIFDDSENTKNPAR